MTDRPTYLDDLIEDIPGKSHLLGAIHHGAARALYRDGWQRGHEVGLKQGRSTLNRGWFMLVLVASSFGFFIGGLAFAKSIYWANELNQSTRQEATE